MRVKFDDRVIQTTDRFISAIEEVMAAECQMMQQFYIENNDTEGAENWIWGRCHIEDLSRRDCLKFEYGGKEDFPDDGLGNFAVIIDASSFLGW